MTPTDIRYAAIRALGNVVYSAMRARCAVCSHRYVYFRMNTHGVRTRRCQRCQNTEFLE